MSALDGFGIYLGSIWDLGQPAQPSDSRLQTPNPTELADVNPSHLEEAFRSEPPLGLILGVQIGEKLGPVDEQLGVITVHDLFELRPIQKASVDGPASRRGLASGVLRGSKLGNNATSGSDSLPPNFGSAMNHLAGG